MKSVHIRLGIILLALGVSGYMLYPTLVWSRLSPEQIAADPQKAESMKSRSINLGLDLQGGIHMVLAIQADKLKNNLLSALNSRVESVFREKNLSVIAHRVTANGIEVEINPAAATDRAAEVADAFKILGYLDKPEFIRNPEQTDRVLARATINSEKFSTEIKEATGRALEIIRNRIDAFGVSEPSIQQVGQEKIVVELPGAADPVRARALIGRTAQLQFHRVLDGPEKVLASLDAATGGELGKLYAATALGEGVFDVHLKPENKERFLALINNPQVRSKMDPAQGIFLGAVSDRKGEPIIPLYLLQAEPAMTGRDLVMARVSYDQRNKASVSFEFGPEGAKDFGQLTAELMRGEKRLAVVLDGVVQSAPSVKSQIKERGEITGNFSHEEARDLAVVLRSGALPAPVEIQEERTVGPSLGRDSISKGIVAAGIGLGLVTLFMLFWYKGSGFIADVTLILNVIIVLAILAAIRGTLTLPGIAGMVLTIGMAVDASILIFERIREELRAGKGVFTAINAGYDKAFSTIFDANLTTLITAGALYQYGTGPIRGFAVTLSIGIIASLFTAVFVSRTIFDLFVLSAKEPRLSI